MSAFRSVLCSLLLICLIFLYNVFVIYAYEVVYAVNCGGEAHIDIYGTKYMKDNLNVGTVSDHGRVLTIQRVSQADQILYQTERYHTDSFQYIIPLPNKEKAVYTLILKFSEVWFGSPNEKVFDVTLNSHTIVSKLDIFSSAGRGFAHDEIIPFRVQDNRIFLHDKEIDLYDNKLILEFVKLDRDNPKINAIVLIKGDFPEAWRLPPLPSHRDQQNNFAGSDQLVLDKQRQEMEQEEEIQRKKRKVSGPKAVDPYSSDPSSWALLPVLIAVAAALPLLFCLCKL